MRLFRRIPYGRAPDPVRGRLLAGDSTRFGWLIRTDRMKLAEAAPVYSEKRCRAPARCSEVSYTYTLTSRVARKAISG